MTVTFIVIYVGWSEPYIEKRTTNFQFFNEAFIAITNYHLMCFADFIEDEPTRNVMGWSLIFCVCFNLFINIGSIMVGVAKNSFKTCKKSYYVRKLNKLKKRRAEKEAAKQKELLESIEKNV